MFTGIIDYQGKIQRRSEKGGQVTFVIQSNQAIRNLKSGQSVAVNGVCLTAVQVAGKTFRADVIRETLENTTLGKLKAGDTVNLERSLRFGDELGGHFVTGHIDGVGKLLKKIRSKKNVSLTFQAPKAMLPYLAPKGSVAVDGISLTIQSVRSDQFAVGIVPHTLKVTQLRNLKVGEAVNLEADLIARYLNVLNSSLKASKPSKSKLKHFKKQGF